MVEGEGTVGWKFETKVIVIGCKSNQQKVKTEPESAMHVQRKTKRR